MSGFFMNAAMRASVPRKPKVYLASRYSRREELCGYRLELEASGFEVVSRWLNGKHQISDTGIPIGDHGEKLVEDGSTNVEAVVLRNSFAREDLADVQSADIVISFTEPPRSGGGRSRGGRHVEFGIALALKKRLIVVGYRENLFHWLPQAEYAENWIKAKQLIGNEVPA